MTHSSLTLQISKLSCGSCVARAEKALRAVDGVDDVAVNLASETAAISFDSPATSATITQALSEAGYPAVEDQVTLDISNMSCGSCVARVEKALSAAPAVTDVSVNLASETAIVKFLPAATTPQAVAKAATDEDIPRNCTANGGTKRRSQSGRDGGLAPTSHDCRHSDSAGLCG